MDSGPEMHKILYVKDGEIEQLGPFETVEIACNAATKAHNDGVFSAHDQFVYLLRPDYSLQDLSADDLGVD